MCGPGRQKSRSCRVQELSRAVPNGEGRNGDNGPNGPTAVGTETARVNSLYRDVLRGPPLEQEAAKLPGEGIWPEAVPKKMRSRKRVLSEISEYRRQKQS